MEDRLVQAVRTSLRNAGISANSKVLVGFSGGRDSTALLATLRPVVLNLYAIHVDHGLRPESAKDAIRVAELAGRLDVPLTVKRLERDVWLKHPGVGIEEALRRERYRAFADTAITIGANLVALGHHAQDQAETVLLHLLRGSGLSGVVGMRQRSIIGVPWWEGDTSHEIVIWRPFLEIEPEVLDWAIERRGLQPVEDPSNDDRAFRRNAVRHDVLPLLEHISHGATGNLARFGSLVADDDEYLDRQANELLGGSRELERRLVLDQHVAIQRRMVRNWLRYWLANVEISRERVDAVLNALQERRGPKRIEIAAGYSVEIGRDSARIRLPDQR